MKLGMSLQNDLHYLLMRSRLFCENKLNSNEWFLVKPLSLITSVGRCIGAIIIVLKHTDLTHFALMDLQL